MVTVDDAVFITASKNIDDSSTAHVRPSPSSSSSSAAQQASSTGTNENKLEETTRNNPTASFRRNLKRTPEGDNDPFIQIRQKCEKHFRRLERYKKSKSLCALDTEDIDSVAEVNRSELLRNNSLGLPTAGVAKKTSIGAINFFDPTSTQGRQYPAPNGSSHNDSMIVDSSGDGVVILPYDNMPVVSRQSMLTLETDSVADSVLLECQSTPSSKSLGKDFCSREQFDQLRETMISLMENDIELLKRLLSLSDTLRDLRRKQSLANETNECRPSSKTEAGGYRMQDDPESNDEGQEEWDEFKPLRSDKSVMGATGSALEVTHLYLGDGGDSEGDIEDNDLKPNTQYFSRKNSILRIPIPPRASNRMLGANIQLPFRTSEVIRRAVSSRQRLAMRKVVPDPSEKPIQEDSGHSSTDSESTPQQHSPNAEEEDGRLKIIEEDRVAAVASSQPTCSPPSSRYNTVTSVSSSTDSGFENSVSLDLLAKLQQAECQN